MRRENLSRVFFPLRFMPGHVTMLVIIALAELSWPLLIMDAIDAVVKPLAGTQKPLEHVLEVSGVLLLIIILQFFLRYLMMRRLGDHVFHAAHSLRLTLIQRLSYSFAGLLSEKKISGLIQQIHRDVADIQDSLVELLSDIPYDVLTIVAVVIAAYFINPVFGAGFSTIVVGGAALIFIFSKKGAKLYESVLVSQEKMIASLNEHIRSARLYLSGPEEKEGSATTFEQSSSDLAEAHRERQKLNAALAPLLGLSEYVGIVLVLVLGGYAASKGEITAGALVAYFAFVEMVAEPLHRAGTWQASLQRFLAAWRRVRNQNEESRKDLKGITTMPERISLKNMTVKNGETGMVILHEMTFEIKRGSIIAVVGRSGSGKTTLLETLIGYRTFEEGKILLDGAQLSEIAKDAWWRLIGSWPQEVLLLERSLEENITLEEKTLDENRLHYAIEASGLTRVIAREEKGVKALCGPDGVRLSGGEKQRVAFARLLYRNPPFVILDEPTSALDVQSEQMVLPILSEFLAGKTCLLVSHRPILLSLATDVLVLDQGNARGPFSPNEVWQKFPDLQELFPEKWGQVA